MDIMFEMKLSTWLLAQFENWKSETDKTLADFAAYLDVPPTSLSNWINAGSKMRIDNVSKISEKLGPEIYDVLGLRRPDADDPRSLLLSAGFPAEFADKVLAARTEYSEELSKNGIAQDSPEAREIVRKAFARHGIQITDTE